MTSPDHSLSVISKRLFDAVPVQVNDLLRAAHDNGSLEAARMGERPCKQARRIEARSLLVGGD
jgi:hypothetical protein